MAAAGVIDTVDWPRPSFTAQRQIWALTSATSSIRPLSPLTKTVGTPSMEDARAWMRNSEARLPLMRISAASSESVWARLFASEPAAAW